MQSKCKFSILLLVLLLFSIKYCDGQVTIGSGIEAEKGALLELKETQVTNPNAGNVLSFENSTKGFLYPKVSLKASTKLTPLYGGIDSGSGNWSDPSTAMEKLLATGMVVYNVNENAIDMDEGLYMWRIDEWIKLSGGMGKASFDPVQCADIRVMGDYIEGKTVTGSEYLSIKVNVTKVGTFVIAATTATGNGYSFYVSGVALEPGSLTINVPSQGKPINVQTDDLIFDGLELAPGCQPTVTVMTSVATYTMNCNSVSVSGTYAKGDQLTTSNKITLNVNVLAAGSYSITTPETNGIYFIGTGVFAQPGFNTVTLQGYGKPTVQWDFPITINTNSANSAPGSTSCSTVIPMTLPRMTYAIIGASNSWYSWDNVGRKAALTQGSSFGPNGLVKTKGLTEVWKTSAANTAISNITNGMASGTAPDIILYFCHDARPTDALSRKLLDYVNAGGCLIYSPQDGQAGDVNIMMTGIFSMPGVASQQPSGSSDDEVYLINKIEDNAVINSPFGDLGGLYWGEDNGTTGTIRLEQLPPNSVQVCSARTGNKPGVPQEHSVVWYNENKNFFYFGDSTGGAINNTESGAFPSTFSSSGIPQTKNYGNNIKGTVCNAALELSAVAWAIKKAAINGINPH